MQWNEAPSTDSCDHSEPSPSVGAGAAHEENGHFWNSINIIYKYIFFHYEKVVRRSRLSCYLKKKKTKYLERCTDRRPSRESGVLRYIKTTIIFIRKGLTITFPLPGSHSEKQRFQPWPPPAASEGWPPVGEVCYWSVVRRPSSQLHLYGCLPLHQHPEWILYMKLVSAPQLPVRIPPLLHHLLY